jgi:aspartyl-tRNA(Asn)/glutamyl-tRNA(Gln) amidotransferase subunit A
VGLKTTYGTISRSGLIALGSSLDQIGPVTKNVEDSEIVFNALCGQDHLDSTTLTDEQYKKAQADGAKKVTTIGVPRNLVGGEGIDADVLANFEESIERLKKLGYKIKDIELPHAKYSLPTYYIMLPGEASSNLARFDGMKYGLYMSGDHLIDDYLLSRGNGFGPEPRRRILLGTYVLSSGYYDAYYNKSQEARKLITKDFTDAWKDVDVIITPTSPTPAFKFGEKTMNPVSMYLADVFTVPSNIADVPTISVPSGTVEREGKNLPLGIQFFGPGCREDLVFEVSKKFLGESES